MARWAHIFGVPRRARLSLADEWREGHLRIADLDNRARVLAVLALVVIVLAGATIVLVGADQPLPGGAVAVPGTMLAEPVPVRIPLVAPLLVGGGLAVGAMLLVEAALRSRRPHPRLVLVAVGLGGAALAATTLNGVGQYDILTESAGTPDPFYTAVPRVAGAAALACALLVAVVPLRWALRWRVPTLLLAALPFSLPLVPLATNIGRDLPISVMGQAMFPQFPETLSGVAWVTGPLQVFATVVGLALIPLGLWQAVTWARASARQAGLRVGAAARRWPALVAGLAAAKLTWLLIGLAGVLPVALGGRSPAWSAIRVDGAFAWAYGLGLLLLAGLAVPYLRRRPIGDRRAERSARWTIFLFWSLFAAAVLLVVLVPLAQLALPDDSAVNAFAGSALDFLLERATFVGALVVIGALVVGVIWLVRRRRTSAAVFLVVLGAWTLPRAISVLSVEAPPELAALAALPQLDAPGLQTMDLLLTAAVLLVALGAISGRLPAASPTVLALALVVSTLLAHGGSLLPIGAGVLLFAVALVFPVAYELTLDSEDLNRTARHRAAGVLRALGLRAAILALVAVAVSIDLTALLGSGRDEFAKLLFALPLSVIIVVVAAQAQAQAGGPADAAADPAAEPPPETGPRRPRPASVLAAVAVGVLVVVGAAVAMRPLDSALGALYPTDAEHLAVFIAERERTGLAVGRLLGGSETEVGEALLADSATASAWLAERQPPACLEPAWQAHRAFLVKLRELALVIRAVEHIIGDQAAATGAERDLLVERLGIVNAEAVAAAQEADRTASAARGACTE